MAVSFPQEGPHLLDTSVVITMMRAGVVASFEAMLPFVARAELLAGTYRAIDATREGAKLQATLGAIPIIYPTKDTVDIYAQAAARLQQVGRSIPTNDLWIAALALEWDLPLLTDDAHFAQMQGLKLLRVR